MIGKGRMKMMSHLNRVNLSRLLFILTLLEKKKNAAQKFIMTESNPKIKNKNMFGKKLQQGMTLELILTNLLKNSGLKM
jgi:hypothetical protein